MTPSTKLILVTHRVIPVNTEVKFLGQIFPRKLNSIHTSAISWRESRAIDTVPDIYKKVGRNLNQGIIKIISFKAFGEFSKSFEGAENFT